MSKDEYLLLFKYMEKCFSSIEARLDQTVSKTDFNSIANSFDAYFKRGEIIMHEVLALGHQVDRQDGWIHKIAKVTDVKLKA